MTAHGEAAAERLAGLVGDATVASAESLTAGRVCERLAAVEGSGTWFRGGLVAYGTEVKRSLLGVSAPSVYSELAVRQMAEGVARLLSATVAVATSGVTGPDDREGVAPGTVFVGCFAHGTLTSHVVHLAGGPEAVCEAAAAAALSLLADHLEAGHRSSGQGEREAGRAHG